MPNQKKGGRPKGSKNKRKGEDSLPAESPPKVPGDEQERTVAQKAIQEAPLSAEDPNPVRELPKINYPSTVLVIGKRFSGKTTLLLNIIDPKEFDNVFIITVSEHLGNLNSLCKSEMCILNSISDEFIDALVEIHRDNQETKTLLLFDDFIGSNFDVKKSQKLRLLATSGRNFNISVVFSSQDIVGIPMLFRRNAEYLFLGAMNANSIEKVAAEYATADMTKKQLEFNLKNIAKDKTHSWLFYDDRESFWRRIEGSDLNPELLSTR